MKRYFFLMVSIGAVLLFGYEAAVAVAAPSWHGSSQLYVEQLRQNLGSPCNPTLDWSHEEYIIYGCLAPHDEPIDMSFGQLTYSGKIRVGDLPYLKQITVPDGYRLVPIADTSGAFLVSDDHHYVPTKPLAYYPDIMSALSWPDLNLALPSEADDFMLSGTAFYALPESLVSSPNGRWIVGENTAGQLFRIDLLDRSIESFGQPYRGIVGDEKEIYLRIPHVAISDDGRTVMVADSFTKAPNNSKLYDMNCAAGCVRNVDDFLKDTLPNFSTALLPHFVSEDAIEFMAETSGSAQVDEYRLSLKPPSPQGEYLAFGDSFASGEGAYYYRYPTDTAANKCHNSLAAYSYIIRGASQSVACSGARLRDLDGSAWGQRSGRSKDSYSDTEVLAILGAFTPGEINQLGFLKRYHPKVATVTVAGNDIGFADIMKQCIDPRSNWQNGATCYPVYEDRFELLQSVYETYDHVVKTYRKMAGASPETDFYVVGYPYIISPTGNCGLNVQLNEDERELAIALTDALNETLAKAARAMGFHYVDVDDAFEGHRLCEPGQAAVNGITAGDDGLTIAGHNILGQETFHPTAYGQQLLAQAIIAATHNMQLKRLKPEVQPVPALNPLKPILTKATQVGRATRQRVTEPKLSADKSKKTVQIVYKNEPKKLKTKQTVTVMVGSKKVTVKTDASGDINLTLDITDITYSGYYDIHLYAEDIFGNLLDIVKTAWLDRLDEANDNLPQLRVSQLGAGGI